MNKDIWHDRIIEMFAEATGTKKKFLSSVLDQIIANSGKNVPTEAQLRIIRPMWKKHEQRKLEPLIGEKYLFVE